MQSYRSTGAKLHTISFQETKNLLDANSDYDDYDDKEVEITCFFYKGKSVESLLDEQKRLDDFLEEALKIIDIKDLINGDIIEFELFERIVYNEAKPYTVFLNGKLILFSQDQNDDLGPPKEIVLMQNFPPNYFNYVCHNILEDREWYRAWLWPYKEVLRKNYQKITIDEVTIDYTFFESGTLKYLIIDNEYTDIDSFINDLTEEKSTCWIRQHLPKNYKSDFGKKYDRYISYEQYNYVWEIYSDPLETPMMLTTH